MRLGQVIAALVLAIASAAAQAQVVGRVLLASGDVVVTRGGRDLPLVTGATIDNGDLVRTGESASVQLRFSDETLVALRARSRFRVEDFRFTGADDGVSRAAFRLLQGGMRTLTGLIGKLRPDRYRLGTRLATVGVRGTAFSLVDCEADCENDDGSTAADGVYGLVYDGRVAVANEGGERDFGEDEAFFVADLVTAPQPLLSRPGFLRDRLEARARREQMRERIEQARREAVAAMVAAQRAAAVADARTPQIPGYKDPRPVGQMGAPTSPIIAVADLKDPDGGIALIGVGLGAGVGFATATDPVTLVDGGLGTVIELDGSRGYLERFFFNGGAQAGDRVAAAVLDSGKLEGDGGAVWGRWAPGGVVRVAEQGAMPPTGVHFFFGNLTPETLFGTLPPGATAVRYDYVGGPNPTDAQGNVGHMLNGAFIVNFLSRTIAGGLAYRIDTTTYAVPVPQNTPLIAGRGWVGFNLGGTDGGGWVNAANGSSGTLDAWRVGGLFLGSRAQGLGVNFSTVDAQSGNTAGAAIFRCVSGGCK